MEIMMRTILGLFFISLTGCGVAQRIQLAPTRPSVPKPGPEPVFLSGTLPLSDGSQLDLMTLNHTPVVLIFASDTCDVCAAEVGAIRKSLARPLASPDRVAVVNAVVSVKQSDAADWKKDHRLPWRVGFDEKLSLFKQWCGPGSVPCTVVQLPEKGIVLTHRGAITPPELEKLTGPLEAKP